MSYTPYVHPYSAGIARITPGLRVTSPELALRPGVFRWGYSDIQLANVYEVRRIECLPGATLPNDDTGILQIHDGIQQVDFYYDVGGTGGGTGTPIVVDVGDGAVTVALRTSQAINASALLVGANHDGEVWFDLTLDPTASGLLAPAVAISGWASPSNTAYRAARRRVFLQGVPWGGQVQFPERAPADPVIV